MTLKQKSDSKVHLYRLWIWVKLNFVTFYFKSNQSINTLNNKGKGNFNNQCGTTDLLELKIIQSSYTQFQKKLGQCQ